MIRINLLGGERQKKKKASAAFDFGQQLTVACSIVLVLTAGGLGWWYWSLGQQSAQVDAELAEAQQQVQRLQPILQELQRSQQRQQLLQQRVALIETLRGGQSLPVQLLDHVSRSLPEMLWLTQMDQQANEVTIEGRSTTLIALSDFVGNLGSTNLLQKPIELVSSQVESAAAAGASVPAGSTLELIRFVVKAQVTPAPAAAPAAGAAISATAPQAGGGR